MLLLKVRLYLIMFLSVQVVCANSLIDVVIPSSSMESTLECGSGLIAVKKEYLTSIKRGDIMLFYCSADDNNIYIKRVVGLPEEHIEIRNGKIYIDSSDKKLEEGYLKENWVKDNDGYIFDVPSHCYLMLGDNRNNSYDSRYWGSVSTPYICVDDILGTAIFQYYPKIKILY